MIARPLVIVAVLLGAPLQAGAQSLIGWLDRDAIPALGETLTRHPRFRGERIDIGPLEAGQPSEHGSALSAWIEQHVSETLLDVPGIRLIGQRPACLDDAPEIYLGIAIGALPGGRYRVALRFLDRAEGVWISGAGAAWEGFLTREQRKALAQSTAPAERSSSLADAGGLAARLERTLSCRARRPGALPPPPWRIAPSDDGRVNAIAAELARRMPGRFTADAGATPLTLSLDPASGRLDLGSALTTLASVPVRLPQAGPPPSPAETGSPVMAAAPGGTSLEVHRIEPQGICTRTRTDRCLDVYVHAPEYARSRLLLTYERAGRHRVRAIDPPGGARGERRLRVAIDRDIDPAPIGVYVLSTADDALARRVDALLGEAGCDRAADSAWIDRLAALADDPALSWQSAQIEPQRLAVRVP